MPNQAQNLNQNSGQNQDQPHKKEHCPFMTIKIFLAVIIFAGVGTIIIVGGLLIGKWKNNASVNNFPPAEKCAKAGEGSSNPSLGPSAPTPKKCCEGLVELYGGLRYEPDSEVADENGCIHWEGSGNLCSDCGNGICESWENRCNCFKDCMEKEITIVTDKMEYEQGEAVKIKIENNLGGKICYLVYSGSDCWKLPFGVEKFSSDKNKWEDIPIGKSIMCSQYMSVPSSKCSKEPINFLWNQNQHNKGIVSPGKYRIKKKKISSPDPENYETIYSNEFTIKEKSVLDLRCSKKIKGVGPCEVEHMGYEFDQNKKICVKKSATGCSFETSFNTLEECQEICEKPNKEVKYQIFSTSIGTSEREEIIDYVYIYKNDKLPKVIELEDGTITIQKIEIQKTGGFMAYATILYNDREKKVGFWHPDGKIQNKENGCLDKNNKQVCGGLLAMNIDKWTEESTKEEKEKGIFYTTYLKRFSLQEIDYDFNSNDLNYIKIIFSLYREPHYPKTTF